MTLHVSMGYVVTLKGLISSIESFLWTIIIEIPFQAWQQGYIIAMVGRRIRAVPHHNFIKLHWSYRIDKGLSHIMSKLVFGHTNIDSHVIEV